MMLGMASGRLCGFGKGSRCGMVVAYQATRMVSLYHDQLGPEAAQRAHQRGPRGLMRSQAAGIRAQSRTSAAERAKRNGPECGGLKGALRSSGGTPPCYSRPLRSARSKTRSLEIILSESRLRVSACLTCTPQLIAVDSLGPLWPGRMLDGTRESLRCDSAYRPEQLARDHSFLKAVHPERHGVQSLRHPAYFWRGRPDHSVELTWCACLSHSHVLIACNSKV
jgi:hypothetical protein